MSTIHEAPKKLSLRRQFAANHDHVDIPNRTITGAIMCQVGDAKGHGLSVNGIMLRKLLSLADPKGVKCYWTHDWEQAGRFLGRFSQLNVSSNQLTGKLTMSALSDDLPNLKGIGTYILKQVSDDADVLMCSVVFSVEYYFQTDANGKEYKVWTYNDAGNWVSPNYEMPIYAMPSDFQSCDIVGDGAVTNAMFSDASGIVEMEKVMLSMQTIESQIVNKNTVNLQNMDEVKKEASAVTTTDTTVVTTPENNEPSQASLREMFLSFLRLGAKKEAASATPTPKVEASTVPADTTPDPNAAKVIELQAQNADKDEKIKAFQIKIAAMAKQEAAPLGSVTPEQGGRVTKLSSLPASKKLNDFVKFGTLMNSTDIEAAINEAAGVKAKGIAVDIYEGCNTLSLVDQRKKIRTKFTEHLVAPNSPQIIEYVNADNAEQSGDIIVKKNEAFVTKFKIEHEFDPHSDLIEAYRELLEDKGWTMDELSIIEYMMTNTGISEVAQTEVENAGWNGKFKTNYVGKRSMEQRMNGFLEIASMSATAGTGAMLIPTGNITDNHTVKFEQFYENLPYHMKGKPIALLCDDTMADRLFTNYGKVYQSSKYVYEDIKKTGLQGYKFHLGGNKHQVVPIPIMKATGGIFATPLDNLEYMYDAELASKLFKLQAIKHKIWTSFVLPFGFRVKKLNYTAMNEAVLNRQV